MAGESSRLGDAPHIQALGRIEGLLTGRFDEVAVRLREIGDEQRTQRIILDDVRDRQARTEERVRSLEESRRGIVEWLRIWGGWVATGLVTAWAALHTRA